MPVYYTWQNHYMSIIPDRTIILVYYTGRAIIPIYYTGRAIIPILYRQSYYTYLLYLAELLYLSIIPGRTIIPVIYIPISVQGL